MGALDKKQKNYFRDPKRFADAWNGILFGGLEVIRWQELAECDSVLTYSDGKGEEKTADVIMKKTMDGKLLALLILENQKEKDYSLPVRVNLEEAIAYDKQVKEINRRNKELLGVLGKGAGQGFDAGEFMYLFRKRDRLRPIITMVLYWNEEEWDGANSLDELIDFHGTEELRDFVPKHPVRIVDMARFNNSECFKTDLRSVTEYFKRRNDKDAFREYYEHCDESYELDGDGMKVVGELVHSEELIAMLKKTKKKRSAVRMCKAIKDLIEEGKQEERMNTEKEKARAEAAETRAEDAEERAAHAEKRAEEAEQKAQKAEQEIEQLRKLLAQS